MRAKNIFIGTDVLQNAIYLSPLNLTSEECETVCRALREVSESLCCSKAD